MEYAVKAEHLTKNFGSFKLDDVNLAVPGGTILGLIGENGAGKSTLIKCLLGILRPTAGSIELLGAPAGQALGDVGYVPDECPFSAMLKIRQAGALMAGMFPAWDEDLFGSYLKKFELPSDQTVKELSRGMKMKLTIAAALAHRPRLLLLDEATSGLDPVIRDEILDEFLNFVSDDDHAVLISSHITSDLEKLCDYVTYLHKGRVVAAGAKDELLARYALLACSREDLERVDASLLAGSRSGEYGAQALVRDREAFRRRYPRLPLDPASLEDIMIYTTRRDR